MGRGPLFLAIAGRQGLRSDDPTADQRVLPVGVHRDHVHWGSGQLAKTLDVRLAGAGVRVHETVKIKEAGKRCSSSPSAMPARSRAHSRSAGFTSTRTMTGDCPRLTTCCSSRPRISLRSRGDRGLDRTSGHPCRTSVRHQTGNDPSLRPDFERVIALGIAIGASDDSAIASRPDRVEATRGCAGTSSAHGLNGRGRTQRCRLRWKRACDPLPPWPRRSRRGVADRRRATRRRVPDDGPGPARTRARVAVGGVILGSSSQPWFTPGHRPHRRCTIAAACAMIRRCHSGR